MTVSILFFIFYSRFCRSSSWFMQQREKKKREPGERGKRTRLTAYSNLCLCRRRNSPLLRSRHRRQQRSSSPPSLSPHSPRDRAPQPFRGGRQIKHHQLQQQKREEEWRLPGSVRLRPPRAPRGRPPSPPPPLSQSGLPLLLLPPAPPKAPCLASPQRAAWPPPRAWPPPASSEGEEEEEEQERGGLPL